MKKFFQILKAALKSFLIWTILMIVFLTIDTITAISKKYNWIVIFFVFIPIICAIWTPTRKLIGWSLNYEKSKLKKQKPKPTLAPVNQTRPQQPKVSERQASRTLSLAHIDKMGGHEFEHFTADLLRKLGYERVEVTQGSGDQGVDVLAVKDGKRYAIQCKRYSQKLGNKPIQEVFAGKTIYGCSVAVVLTNNYFTDGAKDAAKATGVELWDRDTLRRMIDYANYKAIV